jgi:hypothetical protein
MRRARPARVLAMDERVLPSDVVVYRLYGHYSFNSRDGGELVKLHLSDGYTVGQWFNGTKMIVGRRLALSVEQALYHGYAKIVS